MNEYLDKILPDKENVKGEIYLITCSESNKGYVGQAFTHRLNHKKYRPFGSTGRLKDHISAAINNTKKKQCMYLNNAIRKYGADKFSVQLIKRCELDEMDYYETYYIEFYNTLYPNGYNLTKGGKNATSYHKINNNMPLNKPNMKPRKNVKREEITKKKISEALQEFHKGNDKVGKKRADDARQQHDKYRLKRYLDKNIKLDSSKDIKEYIRPVYRKYNKNEIGQYEVVMNSVRTAFHVTKHETSDDTYKRAIAFLEQLR